MSTRPHLRGQTPESLAALWPDLELTPTIARRIVSKLVGEDSDDLEGVDGLAGPRAAALRERADTARIEVLDRRRSLKDPFVKYLFRAGDGALFESVRLPLEKPRWSVCVSSQAGCAMRCAFCATGRLGLTRNLEAWEMVEQVLTIRREAPERPVSGVVFQGQGEPMMNYDNVIRAIEILRSPSGARIRGDRITISTVGIPAMIERFREEEHPYRLLVSLASTFPERRAGMLPVASQYEPAVLADALTRLARQRNEPVTLAWVLVSGLNTGVEEAEGIRRLFPDVRVRVSVIEVNDPSGEFKAPSEEERGAFISALADRKIGFTRRYSGGTDIAASCGLLASTARGGAELPAPETSAQVTGG